MLVKFLVVMLGATLLFLSGCVSQKQVVVAQDKVLPSWYTSPPLSNSDDLYAIGDGKDKKEAISNALAFMASTLSVSISSSYSANTVVKEGRINNSQAVYNSDIQSDVKEIRISSYKVLHAESLGFKKYAVLVKSNKKKLFDSLRQEIIQKFEIISQEEKTVQNLHMLKQFSFYKEASDSLKSIPNTLIVMNVLNPAFVGADYLKTMQDINSKYEYILANISFAIHSDKNADNLRSPIAKGLTAKKLKIKKSGSKMHFSVYIKANVEYVTSYGFSLARSEITITTMDSEGSVVGSNALNLVGQSSQGFGVAKQNVAYKLNALIKKEGISKVMGLDI